MKMLSLLFLAALYAQSGYTQVYQTKNGYLGFFSKTPLEDITAENHQVYGVINLGDHSLSVACLVKGFLFTKALMQEHFNENYIESDKFPRASFSGTYSGGSDSGKNGIYPVRVSGQLTLHGITRPIDVPGSVEVSSGKVTCSASFSLLPGDFNISIPSLVRDKIAKQIDVHIILECYVK